MTPRLVPRSNIGPNASTELPAASETSEKWRSITTRHLYEQMSQEGSGGRKERTIMKVTDELRSQFIDLTTDHRLDGHLRRMVETGWEVAATLAQQRCRLDLWTSYPHGSRNSVEGWPVDAFEDLDNRPVGPHSFIFTVAPALLKWGNGYGQDLEKCLFIVKSRGLSKD